MSRAVTLQSMYTSLFCHPRVYALVVPLALLALTSASIVYRLQSTSQRHDYLSTDNAAELAPRHRSLPRCARPLQRCRVRGHLATSTRRRKRINTGEPGQAAISELPRDCSRGQGRQPEELQGALLLFFGMLGRPGSVTLTHRHVDCT